MNPEKLNIWTIYDRPTDYPSGFIARLFVDFKPSDTTMTGPTLDAVRGAIQHITPYVLSRIERNENDEPQIVESWI